MVLFLCEAMDISGHAMNLFGCSGLERYSELYRTGQLQRTGAVRIRKWENARKCLPYSKKPGGWVRSK